MRPRAALPRAAIAEKKRQPYHPDRRSLANHNGKVKTTDGQLLTCRHLTMAYLRPDLLAEFFCEIFDDAHKDELQALLSRLPDGIKANYLQLKADLDAHGPDVFKTYKLNFLDAVAQSPLTLAAFFSSKAGDARKLNKELSQIASLNYEHQQMVGNQGFGLWLSDVSAKMQADGLDQAQFIMTSHGHVMAVRLEWKEDPDGSRRICVSCYDPNVTGNHRRFEAATPAELRQQSVESCFDGGLGYSESGSPETTCFTMISADMTFTPDSSLRYVTPNLESNGPSDEVPASPDAQPPKGTLHEGLFSEALSLAMRGGNLDVLEGLQGHLRPDEVDKEKALALLDLNRVCPGSIQTSLDHNPHAEAFRSYVEMLEERGIGPEDSARLLKLTPQKGTPDILGLAWMSSEARRHYVTGLETMGIKGALAASMLADTRIEDLVRKYEPWDLWGYGLDLTGVEVTGELALPLVTPRTEGAELAAVFGNPDTARAYVGLLDRIEVKGELAAPLLAKIARALDAQGILTPELAQTLRQPSP